MICYLSRHLRLLLGFSTRYVVARLMTRYHFSKAGWSKDAADEMAHLIALYRVKGWLHPKSLLREWRLLEAYTNA